MIFDLVKDFADVLEAMPREQSRFGMLKLLEEAIRRDVHFIDRHPTTFFQCMWNTCWWYDSPASSASCFALLGDAQVNGHAMSRLMEIWLRSKSEVTPGFTWIRSLRAPAIPLESALIGELRGNTRAVRDIAFSPDGRWLASVSEDSTLRVWDVRTGLERLQIQQQQGYSRVVSWSSDGRTLVTGAGGPTAPPDEYGLQVWDAETGVSLSLTRGSRAPILSIAQAGHGGFLAAAAADGTVRVWSPSLTGVLPVERVTFSVPAICCAEFFDGCKQLAIGSVDGQLSVWDVFTRRETLSVPAHDQAITALTYVRGSQSRPGQAGSPAAIFTASPDGTVQGWRMDGSRREFFQLNVSKPSAIAFSRSKNLCAVGSAGGEIDLFDAEYWHCGGQLLSNAAAIQALQYSPDGSLLASASDDATIRLWNAGTYSRRFGYGGRQFPSLAATIMRNRVGAHAGINVKYAMSSDRRYAAIAGWGRGLILWDLHEATPKWERMLPHTQVGDVGFSVDGRSVIVLLADQEGSYATRAWDIESKDETPELLETGRATCAEVRSTDRNPVWRRGTGETTLEAREPIGWFPVALSGELSADGRYWIATEDDQWFPFLLSLEGGDTPGDSPSLSGFEPPSPAIAEAHRIEWDPPSVKMTIGTGQPPAAEIVFCIQCGARHDQQVGTRCRSCQNQVEDFRNVDVTVVQCTACKEWSPAWSSYCAFCGQPMAAP